MTGFFFHKVSIKIIREFRIRQILDINKGKVSKEK